VGTTVENADRLLDIWIKVLSQAEHTQRLLLDGQWQGASEVPPSLTLPIHNPLWNDFNFQDARAQEELLRLESEAAAAASRAAEIAKQKAAEAAEKAKLEAVSRAAAKTPTRGRGILKNSNVPMTSTRGRGMTSQTPGSTRGRGTVGVGRGSTRGTTSTSATRGGSVRGRGSLVRS